MELILIAGLAGAFGWKASAELDLPNPVHGSIFAILFAVFGPTVIASVLAPKGASVPFHLGDVTLSIGLAVCGVVVFWLLQSRR